MRGTSASLSGDRTQRRHGGRWIKSIAGGITVTALAAVMVAGAIATAGRVLAVSRDTNAQALSLIGVPAQNHRLISLRDPGIPVPLHVALEAQPEAPEIGAPGTLAARFALASSGTLEGAPDDLIFTGSVTTFGSRFDALASAPDIRLPNIEERPLPIPRARPRLAALPPASGFDIAPENSAVPPKTAIYDITSKTVYMPNGERLEAHSGFGPHMDNPKYVRLRMRGVTPPNTYRLAMREALFHGVEAIRMHPEDKAAMFGRNGILVHSYMLGPSGQSNGCVSIKDYPKFLAAFKRGEVERMVVVFKLDKPPVYARKTIRSAANTL